VTPIRLPAAPARDARLWGGGLLLLGLLLLASIFVGRYPGDVFRDPLAQQLALNLRLPRALMALLLGMSLGAAGATLQMLFGNPLVEPGFLGVSQGAAFGAALALIFWGSTAIVVQMSALVFALLGLALSYFLARRARFGGIVLRLLLAGVAVSALFSAGLGLLKYLADPLSQLPELTFWTLGALSGINWSRFLGVLPLAGAGLVVMSLMRWRLNLLALDEATAASLGVAVGRERALLLAAAVAAVAAVTSVSGIVGWVGLITPHIARRLVGVDTRRSLPLAMFLGGAFTLICDGLARTLLAGELPLGVLTSFLGASAFLALMLLQNVRVER
jgi:iron complex transport system permease protein